MDTWPGLGPGDDPLSDDSPETWERLVQAIGPASVLVFLEGRMGPRLRAAVGPEDLWQETLLHVWRDRGRCEWRGISPFRRWVLTVAENRIRNAADRIDAVKRAGDAPVGSDGGEEEGSAPPPVSSTTPSQIASHLEEAALMRTALGGLAEDVRDVVRLRLFEERSVDEVAAELDLGVSAVKHRFRKGAGEYQARLERLLAER